MSKKNRTHIADNAQTPESGDNDYQSLLRQQADEQVGELVGEVAADGAETTVADAESSATEENAPAPENGSVNPERNLYLDNEGNELDMLADGNGLDGQESPDDNPEEMLDSEEGKGIKTDKVNLSALFRMLMRNWWMILLNCVVVGTIAALLIVEEPRVYTTDVKLAPEAEDVSTGGTLSSIASSFGIDLGNISTSDAIRPDLYPDLVASSDFIIGLFDIPVKTLNGNVFTDYHTYLKKYQRMSWWRKELRAIMLKFNPPPPSPQKNASGGSANGKEPSRVLTYEEESLIEGIRNTVVCSVDKRTFIISISVSDQDPLVAATVADSVRLRIQNFITDYRTKKASKDYQYYYNLLKQAKAEYEQSCAAYSRYVDTHRDVILQAFISERDQLENDMQLKLNTYNAMLTQTQNAKAKIQEQTPAFTVLQNAFVPVKPTGPKRMFFVAAWVLFTLFATGGVLIIKNLL